MGYRRLDNKHNQLADKAFPWLAQRITGKGLRGAVEVFLEKGYVVDAVFVGDYQARFAEESGVYSSTSHIFVFEAKVSYSDFISTFGRSAKHANRRNPVGSFHWVVISKGMESEIKPYHVPYFWGILIESGKGLKEIKKPLYCAVREERYLEICHTLLWKGGVDKRDLLEAEQPKERQ